MRINAFRNRVAVDTALQSGITEVRTGGSPFWWNGSAVQFEVALFDEGVLVDDLSNLDQVQLDIKPSDDKTGLPIMSKVVASGALDGTLTLDEWNAGDESSCHALVSFTSEEAKIDLEGADSAQFWLVISALRSDGEPIVLGCTLITCEEDGYGVAMPAEVTTPIFFTAAQCDARYVRALDLSTIENNITTLQGEMTTVTATATAAQTAAAAALPLAGGVMTGHITLYTGTNPAGAQALSKGYADAIYLALAGGTVIGATVFSAAVTAATAPTVGGHLANKTYVDAQVAMALPLAGGVMTGHITLYTGTNPAGAQALSKGYADTVYLALAGGTVTGLIAAATAPTAGSHLTNKSYVDGQVATALPLAGGVMTGHITLYTGTNPAGAQALSKGYADTLYLSVGGGTVTGLIAAATAPTAGSHLANKTYVDAQVATALALAGGNMTGLLAWTSSTTAGLKLNNLTDTQRAVLAPAAGMIVFNTSLGMPQYYNGTTWVQVVGGSGTGSTWLTNAGVPAGGLGADADWCLDTGTSDIYLKAAGAWALAGPQKLSLSGGTMTGGLTFDASVGTPIAMGTNWGISIVAGELWIAEGGASALYTVTSGGVITVNAVWYNAVNGYEVSGVQVVGNQQAAIADGSDATVNSILAALRTHGLIAT